MLILQSVAALVNRAPNALLVIPMWLLAAVAFRQVFSDGGGPPWDYLWDDKKNFTKNPHMKLNLANVRWAFRDGVVLGVYEPVSLLIKQVLHTFIKFDARMYRLVNFVAHLINIYLAFSAGREFLYSVNDYSFHAKNLADLIAEKEGTLGSESERNKRSLSSQKSEIKTWLKNAQATLSCLKMHEAMGTFGCMLGISVFAVHPLQAQTIGWASCMSYFFSCSFALLSFDSYVKHRTFMREWRRTRRSSQSSDKNKRNVFGIAMKGPWQLFSSARTNKEIYAEPETWMLTIYKVASIICYVLATFCKSPAVTLPLVFIIIDVFVYSSPLSVHPEGASVLNAAMGQRLSNNSTTPPSSHLQNVTIGLRKLFPNRLFKSIFSDTLPKLLPLTMRAVKASAVFLLVVPLVVTLLVRSNSKFLMDNLTPFQKTEKALWAVAWYVGKFFAPINLVAQVEMLSFSFLDHWEVAFFLALVPYGTLAILANSLSSTPRRLIACSWAVFVALLLPSLGFIQHGRTVLAADRYMYIPLVMMGPILGAMFSAWYTVTVTSELPVVISSTYAGGPVPKSVTGTAWAPKAIDSFDASYIADVIEGRHGGKLRGNKLNNRSVSVKTQSKFELSALFFALLMLVLVSISISAAYLTPSLLYTWRSDILLWERNARILPQAETAHVNLILPYANDSEIRDLDKSLFHAKAALAIRPDIAKYIYNVAVIYRTRNELDEAKEFILKSFHGRGVASHEHMIRKLYGQILMGMGEWEESQRQLELAVSMKAPGAKAELDSLMMKRKNVDARAANEKNISV